MKRPARPHLHGQLPVCIGLALILVACSGKQDHLTSSTSPTKADATSAMTQLNPCEVTVNPAQKLSPPDVLILVRRAWGARDDTDKSGCWTQALARLGVVDKIESAASSANAGDWPAIMWFVQHRPRAKLYFLIEGALMHEDETARISGARAIGGQRVNTTVLKMLKTALNDRSPNVRAVAAESAGALDHPAAIGVMHRRRKVEKDPKVRAAMDEVLKR